MGKISTKHFILDAPSLPSIKTRVLNELRAVKYKCGLNCISLQNEDKKYNVAICAIFKNEALYLKEWILFNHIVGVDHFYLYNNNSEDDYLSVLQPFIDSGLVTLVQWPKNHAQMECYADGVRRFKKETKWIGFIDLDEFIVPKESNNIYDFLKKFEKNRGSVKIYWRMFGTSGMLDMPENKLVTEAYTVCWPKYYSVGKCFYNTKFDFDASLPQNFILHHLFWASHKGKKYPPVNIFDKICLPARDQADCDDHPIQINHYFSKSYQEYAVKRTRGDVFFEVSPRDEAYFYEHEIHNTSTDYSAYKYLIKLKQMMKDFR